MKQQVFYIHGGSSYSDYNAYLKDLRTAPIRDLPGIEPIKKWTHSLREDLGSDFEVFMPAMPNAQNAHYVEWKIWFERHFEFLRDDLVLLGWSQGGFFLAKYLVENCIPVKVRALILCAAPVAPDDFGGEDGGDFAFDKEGLSAMQEKVDEIHIFHSKDDFIVPYTHALQYQAALSRATLHSFEDKNHFLVPELPELLALIKELIQSH